MQIRGQDIDIRQLRRWTDKRCIICSTTSTKPQPSATQASGLAWKPQQLAASLQGPLCSHHGKTCAKGERKPLRSSGSRGQGRPGRQIPLEGLLAPSATNGSGEQEEGIGMPSVASTKRVITVSVAISNGSPCCSPHAAARKAGCLPNGAQGPSARGSMEATHMAKGMDTIYQAALSPSYRQPSLAHHLGLDKHHEQQLVKIHPILKAASQHNPQPTHPISWVAVAAKCGHCLGQGRRSSRPEGGRKVHPQSGEEGGPSLRP